MSTKKKAAEEAPRAREATRVPRAGGEYVDGDLVHQTKPKTAAERRKEREA